MRPPIVRLAVSLAFAAAVVGLHALGADDPSVANTVRPRLRVVTWNLHQGYSASGQHVNGPQLDLLASLDPDVVALQELAEWDNDMPALYEQGLEARTGRSWTMRYERHLSNASLSQAEGVAVATWLPVDAQSFLRMTDPAAPGDLVRNRAAVRLQVTLNELPLNLVTAHLDYLDVANRRSQLDRLQAWLDTFGPRRIVAGDFNAEPADDATFSAWRTQYTDIWDLLVYRLTGDQGWTMNRRTTTGRAGRIDYQWVTGLAPRSVSVVKTQVSDHNLLVVDYDLPAASGPVNQPPVVALNEPPPGARFDAPASIDLAAEATDGDGTVGSVTFYSGSQILGTDTSAPFTHRWESVPAGRYTLTAVAVDDRLGRTVSAPLSVEVSNPPNSEDLPAGWTSQDVGSVGLAGRATEVGGAFAVTGAGADIWGSADSFHFAFQPLNGDGEIRARVTRLDNTHAYAKAGVMIRETLAAGAKHVIVNLNPSGQVEILARNAAGGATAYLGGASPGFPAWLRLRRTGSTVTAAWSSDGLSWTTVATTTISMASNASVGLAVTSHTTSTLATGAFDNVVVAAAPPPPANAPPAASLTSPSAGAGFAAPANVALAATASDSDGSVTKVDFFNGTTLIGTDTSAPYQASWASVPAGSYALTAVATDNEGATATSASVGITVSAPPTNTPPTVSLTAPTAGATFTAPATVALAATAGDSDGSVTKVDFFSGTALIATDTTAPYQASWTSVPAGSYTLRAVATDNAGATTTSASVSIAVGAPQTTLTISASPSRRRVSSGGTATYTVNVTASGLASPVQFAVTGLPSYATATFSPTTLAASGSTTLSIRVSSSAPRSTHTLTITATSGTAQRTASVVLEIRR